MCRVNTAIDHGRRVHKSCDRLFEADVVTRTGTTNVERVRDRSSRHIDIRNLRRQVSQPLQILFAERLPRDDHDRYGDVFQVLLTLLRGDHDLFKDPVASFRCRRRVLDAAEANHRAAGKNQSRIE